MSVIGVDCDNTVVGVDLAWWDWLNSVCLTDKKYPAVGIVDYDLSSYFRNELKARKMDGYEWWRGTTQYDMLKPYPEAVASLKRLSAQHQIVFVSSIKGFHCRSKYYFLQRHFPFMTEVTYMKKKYFAKVDVLIDDRNEHHNHAPDGRINIKFDAGHTQEHPLTQTNLFISNDWNEIEQYLREKLN